MAAVEHAQEIADRRAMQARHHADAPRQEGNRPGRPFAVVSKQTLGRQSFLELLEGERQCPLALWLNALDDEAVAALWLIEVDAALSDHREPVAQAELEPLGRGSPHLRVQASVGVFEAEVEVAAGVRSAESGNFSAD